MDIDLLTSWIFWREFVQIIGVIIAIVLSLRSFFNERVRLKIVPKNGTFSYVNDYYGIETHIDVHLHVKNLGKHATTISKVEVSYYEEEQPGITTITYLECKQNNKDYVRINANDSKHLTFHRVIPTKALIHGEKILVETTKKNFKLKVPFGIIDKEKLL